MIALEDIKEASATDKAALLGRLVWYSISDVCVSHEDVLKGLTAVGLQSHVPPYPKNFDVFRRVSTAAQRRKVPTATEGVFENYMVREVAGRGEDVVTRRIVVETVDRKGKTLDYKQLRDVEFHKTNGNIVVKELPDHVTAPYATRNPNVVAITEEIKIELAKWLGKLNSYSIREFIRKMVLDMGATLVREGGGVYFLLESQSATVDALEKFVNDLSADANFHSLPLVDDKKQRAMVRRAYEAETIDEIDAMMADIREIKIAGKKISSDRYAAMVTKYQNLTKNTLNYEQVLEVGLGEAKSRLAVFQASIVGLMEMVKS